MRRFFVALVALLAAATGHTAFGAPPERLELSSNSSCPTAMAVVTELGPLLPRTRVQARSGLQAAPTAAQDSIEDEGAHVRVRVAGQERVFRDPERSCRERARTAAVFIGLALDPPSLPEVEATPNVTQRAPSPPVVTAEPNRSGGPRLTLELGPLLQAAPRSNAAQLPLAGGFGARVAHGRTVALSAGAAFLLPARLVLPAADARLVWLPFDVSLRLSRELGALSLSAELGPELALLFASGDRVRNPRTSTRIEPGARLAGTVSWWMSGHVGAFLTLFASLRPHPYRFEVNPGLPSGTTPPLWLGASVGVSLRAR